MQIGQRLGLTEEMHAKWVKESRPVRLVAIDRPCENSEGEGATLHELLADDRDETGRARMEQEERLAELMKRIEGLPAQQKQILAMFYFEGMRVGEIARAFRLTPSRVSQIHREAVEKLRTALKSGDAIYRL